MARVEKEVAEQDEPRKWKDVVGVNATRRRLDLEMTQEQVAERLRQLGLRWSRAAVADLEAGKRAPDYAEMHLVAIALAMPPERFLELDDDDETIRVGSCRLTGLLLRSLPRRAGRSAKLEKDIQNANSILKAEERLTLARGYGLPDERSATLALRSTGEAERRAAVRMNAALGITDPDDRVTGFEVSCVAQRLWGHGLSAERDRLVAQSGAEGPSAQAKAGRISRQLDDAIESKIREVRGIQ